MERGCLPANSVVDVDELPPLPHAQGPTNYLRDPLSTWERLTLSNTFCESRALSVLRQNKEDLNTYCLNMAVCRRKMKKGRQWTVDRRRSPFSQANGEVLQNLVLCLIQVVMTPQKRFWFLSVPG